MELVRGVGVARPPETKPRPPDVVVATPSYDGNVSLEYLISLFESTQVCLAHGIIVDSCFVRGDCFIGKARNNLVSQFLNRDGGAIFFIDADEGWDAQGFLRIVMDQHEIVSAAVPKKIDEVTYNNVDLITNEKNDCVIDGGLLEVRSIGTGFMRIKRSVIEKMILKAGKYIPGDGSHPFHYDLFEPTVRTLSNGDRQFYGEDIQFCSKWREMGGRIWVDPNVNFKHVGRKAWTGNFLQYLQSTCKVQLKAA